MMLAVMRVELLTVPLTQGKGQFMGPLHASTYERMRNVDSNTLEQQETERDRFMRFLGTKRGELM